LSAKKWLKNQSASFLYQGAAKYASCSFNLPGAMDDKRKLKVELMLQRMKNHFIFDFFAFAGALGKILKKHGCHWNM